MILRKAYTLLAVLAAGCFGLAACSSDTTTNPPAAPAASFTISDTATTEGKSVTFTNTSTNATTYAWFSIPASLSSTSKNVTYTFDTAGTYSIYMVATGSGGSDTVINVVHVGMDYTWRATNDSSKVWNVTSLKLNGQEQATQACIQDNTVAFAVKPASTFTYSEGVNICPNPQIPPQTGAWALSADGKTMSLTIASPPLGKIDCQVSELTRHHASASGVSPNTGSTISFGLTAP
jgi:PKD repeat protein